MVSQSRRRYNSKQRLATRGNSATPPVRYGWKASDERGDELAKRDESASESSPSFVRSLFLPTCGVKRLVVNRTFELKRLSRENSTWTHFILAASYARGWRSSGSWWSQYEWVSGVEKLNRVKPSVSSASSPRSVEASRQEVVQATNLFHRRCGVLRTRCKVVSTSCTTQETRRQTGLCHTCVCREVTAASGGDRASEKQMEVWQPVTRQICAQVWRPSQHVLVTGDEGDGHARSWRTEHRRKRKTCLNRSLSPSRRLGFHKENKALHGMLGRVGITPGTCMDCSPWSNWNRPPLSFFRPMHCCSGMTVDQERYVRKYVLGFEK